MNLGYLFLAGLAGIIVTKLVLAPMFFADEISFRAFMLTIAASWGLLLIVVFALEKNKKTNSKREANEKFKWTGTDLEIK